MVSGGAGVTFNAIREILEVPRPMIESDSPPCTDAVDKVSVTTSQVENAIGLGDVSREMELP